jgi:hypothetical protein
LENPYFFSKVCNLKTVSMFQSKFPKRIFFLPVRGFTRKCSNGKKENKKKKLLTVS